MELVTTLFLIRIFHSEGSGRLCRYIVLMNYILALSRVESYWCSIGVTSGIRKSLSVQYFLILLVPPRHPSQHLLPVASILYSNSQRRSLDFKDFAFLMSY